MLRVSLRMVHHILIRVIPKEINHKILIKAFLGDLVKQLALEIRRQGEQEGRLLQICSPLERGLNLCPILGGKRRKISIREPVV